MHYFVDFRKKVIEDLKTSTIRETAQKFKIAVSAYALGKSCLKIQEVCNQRR